MIIKPSCVYLSMEREKSLVCCSKFCEVLLLVLWLLPLWFCCAVQRFCCLKFSGRTSHCCLKVGRALIARRFPWWDELHLSSMKLIWVEREDGHHSPVEWRRKRKMWAGEARLLPSEGLHGKKWRGGGLILARWPHRSWGPEWPIVVETCVPGPFSHLCVTEFWRVWFSPEQRTCGRRLLTTHEGRIVVHKYKVPTEHNLQRFQDL